jgi:hypothetical protein
MSLRARRLSAVTLFAPKRCVIRFHLASRKGQTPERAGDVPDPLRYPVRAKCAYGMGVPSALTKVRPGCARSNR